MVSMVMNSWSIRGEVGPCSPAILVPEEGKVLEVPDPNNYESIDFSIADGSEGFQTSIEDENEYISMRC
jgi:hypothetical protein